MPRQRFVSGSTGLVLFSHGAPLESILDFVVANELEEKDIFIVREELGDVKVKVPVKEQYLVPDHVYVWVK